MGGKEIVDLIGQGINNLMMGCLAAAVLLIGLPIALYLFGFGWWSLAPLALLIGLPLLGNMLKRAWHRLTHR